MQLLSYSECSDFQEYCPPEFVNRNFLLNESQIEKLESYFKKILVINAPEGLKPYVIVLMYVTSKLENFICKMIIITIIFKKKERKKEKLEKDKNI